MPHSSLITRQTGEAGVLNALFVRGIAAISCIFISNFIHTSRVKNIIYLFRKAHNFVSILLKVLSGYMRYIQDGNYY